MASTTPKMVSSRSHRLLLPVAGLALGGVLAVFALATSGEYKLAGKAARRAAGGEEAMAQRSEARPMAPRAARELARGSEPEPASPVEQPAERVPSIDASSEIAALEARRFSSPEEERQVWSERLRGEKFTLQNQKKTAAHIERVLESGANQGGAELTQLAERQALLKAKIQAQSERVAWLERRAHALAQN